MKKIGSLYTALILLAGAPSAWAADADQVAKGEYLARAGDCVVCHTGPGGRPFAGGLKMAVPFLGAIYTTNITPDKETGIGNYSYEDFENAMRKGVAKDGHRLYPAMPYPSFAKIDEDDLRALYAFFMQAVPPVKQANMPTEIPAPLNQRWPLAIWDILFNPSSGYAAKTQHDVQWNRGAYLVQGLGHCGSCHTPRGFVFEEEALDENNADFLAGAELDAWSAPDLSGDKVAGLGRWSETDAVAFLKTGHNDHGTAFGTMIDVINNSTQYLNDDDLMAIAKYLKSLPDAEAKTQAAYAYDPKDGEALRTGSFDSNGAKIYAMQCTACHAMDGQGHSPFLPPLAGNPAVLDKNPSSLVNVTLNGSSRIVVHGLPDAYRMPEFRLLLNDQEIADVVSFIRKGWGNNSAAVAADAVTKIRNSTDPASDAVLILRMK